MIKPNEFCPVKNYKCEYFDKIGFCKKVGGFIFITDDPGMSTECPLDRQQPIATKLKPCPTVCEFWDKDYCPTDNCQLRQQPIAAVNKFCPVEKFNCVCCFDDSCDALGVTTNLKLLDGSILYKECIVPGLMKRIVNGTEGEINYKLPEYLSNISKMPYHRVIVPDSEHGYAGLILEFPGCLTQGETLEETYNNLSEATNCWIGAALRMGQTIPLPFKNTWKLIQTDDYTRGRADMKGEAVEEFKKVVDEKGIHFTIEYPELYKSPYRILVDAIESISVEE